MPMSSNGNIIGDDRIAVDHWLPSSHPIQIHFLTHLHADHIVGLNRAWTRPIYTSELNCKLAPKFIPGIKTSIFKPLKLNEETTLALSNNVSVLVTLIDANHVPGAVMVLIKGYFGNILYTGDFRFRPEMLLIEPLKIMIQREDLDVLYLDNTFFYPTCDFPCRDEVMERLLSKLAHYPCHKIYIGLRKLGKERLLIELAQRLNERIVVDNERLEILKIMQAPDVFTTDPNASRIHCVHMHLLKRKFMEEENQKRPTIGVMPTALYYGWDCSEKAPYSISDTYNLFVFEMSDHSSYGEIIDFVSSLKPKIIKPIVKTSEAKGLLKEWKMFHEFRIDMTPLKKYLSNLPQKFFVTPKSLSDESCHLTELKKKPKTKIKERIYRGPKGPVYESTLESFCEEKPDFSTSEILNKLSNVSEKIHLRVSKKTLNEINQYLDQLEQHLK